MPDPVKDRRESVVVWFFVVLLQGALVWLVLRIPAPFGHAAQDDDALLVEFIARRVAPSESSRARRELRRPGNAHMSVPTAAPGRATVVASNVRPTADPGASAAERPLDLHLRASDVPIVRRDSFQRPPPIEAHRTRFADAWVPEGDVLRQASFHSPIVAGALNAFGGPPRHCTEVERRLRQISCLPLHGQDAADEALRRSLDP